MVHYNIKPNYSVRFTKTNLLAGLLLYICLHIEPTARIGLYNYFIMFYNDSGKIRKNLKIQLINTKLCFIQSVCSHIMVFCILYTLHHLYAYFFVWCNRRRRFFRCQCLQSTTVLGQQNFQELKYNTLA